MSSLLLRHLAYLGPDKSPASISFRAGLNIICGASETGKSFIVESIDFMLGGGDVPRDLPERVGYDRVRMLIESAGWPPLALERSVEGGNFRAYDQELLDGEPETEPKILREKHSAARQDTISHALLERLGLTSKRLRKSRANDTRSLSFRDLARLSVVTEEEIQMRKSPLLSGQFTQATPEYAAFKLLLTGVDDSALVADKEVEGRRDVDAGKIEILNQLIDEMQKEIDEEALEEAELTDQLSRLEAQIAEQNEALNQIQGALNELLQTRAYQSQEIRRRRGRRDEIDELTKRLRYLTTTIRPI
jgi:DNA repair ATPase RecN